jgi:hypothetical protein
LGRPLESFLRDRLLAASPSAEVLSPQDADRLMALYREQIDRLAASSLRRDASDDSPDDIRGWLRALPVQPTTPVHVLWVFDGAGGSLRLADVIDRYDTLWRPSSDDMWVVAADLTWSLLIDHEEQLAFAWIGPSRFTSRET